MRRYMTVSRYSASTASSRWRCCSAAERSAALDAIGMRSEVALREARAANAAAPSECDDVVDEDGKRRTSLGVPCRESSPYSSSQSSPFGWPFTSSSLGIDWPCCRVLLIFTAALPGSHSDSVGPAMPCKLFIVGWLRWLRWLVGNHQTTE